MLVDEAGRTMTFVAFRDRCEVVAAGLYAMGVRPTTPVSWQLPTRIETIVLSMALARLGVVQNPIIHIYREREVAFALAQTGAGLLLRPRGVEGLRLRRDGGEDRCRPGRGPRPWWWPTTRCPKATRPRCLLPRRRRDDQVRWIYYTSGTTSDPKGVRHTDTTLVTGGRGLAMAVELTESGRGVDRLPLRPHRRARLPRHGARHRLLHRAPRGVRARPRPWRCSPATA